MKNLQEENGEMMHDYDYEFIRNILETAYKSAPLGFDNAKLEYDGYKLEWTTIIVNDMPMMEVKLWDKVGDFLYWRVSDLENAVGIFGRWYHDYERIDND